MFRFTIRDVLWLTVVVGAFVAWYADRRKLSDANNTVKAVRDKAYLLGDGPITTMRLGGYEIDSPTWSKEIVARTLSKPKQATSQKAPADEN